MRVKREGKTRVLDNKRVERLLESGERRGKNEKESAERMRTGGCGGENDSEVKKKDCQRRESVKEGDLPGG